MCYVPVKLNNLTSSKQNKSGGRLHISIPRKDNDMGEGDGDVIESLES